MVYNSILANNYSGPYYSYENYGHGGGASGSILYNCVLTNNTADGVGGGASDCTLYNCVLTDNTAGSGGGAYQCNLYNCKLTNNSVDGYGGGGAFWSTLVNCILTGNVAVSDEFGYYGGYGGGAFASELYNCTVVDNLAWVAGGGVVVGNLANCIVAYNAAWTEPNYANMDYYEPSVLNDCCTTPMPTSGIGNITNAPRFVDFANGNLRLQSNSPCINAGNNAYAPGPVDLDGQSRIVSGTVDIGAYEFQGSGSRLSYAWLQNFGLPTDGSADFADADLDGRNTWQEWRCLTDPTNALSVLRLLSASPSGTNVLVRWPSAAGVNYFLERSTNVTGPLPIFTPVATGLMGQASLTTFTDTNAARLAPLFYRVGVGN